MAFRDSGWVGGGVLDAQEARLATGALAMAGAGPIQARSGVKPAAGSPGLVAQTGTASAGVLINALQGTIQGTRSTSAGSYLVTSDAQFTLDILAGAPADPTNPRNDLIIARQRDTQWADAATAFDIIRVGGTPAGSPVDPTVTGDYIPLARVRVNAAVTTITAAVITDLRPWSVAAGGVLPVTSQAERDALAPYAGLAVWRIDTNPQRLEVWDSFKAGWTIVGPPALPMLSVYRNGGFSLTGTGLTVIPWDSEDYQDNVAANAMHNSGVNPSRLIAPAAGKYAMQASVEVSSNAAAPYLTINLRLNGTTTLRWDTATGTVSKPNQVSAGSTCKLAAGDYVEVLVSSTVSGHGLVAGNGVTYATMSFLSS